MELLCHPSPAFLQVEKEKLTQSSPQKVSLLLPFPPSLVLVGILTAVSIIIIFTRTPAVSTGIFSASGIWADHSSTSEPHLYPPKKDFNCFELVHIHVG